MLIAFRIFIVYISLVYECYSIFWLIEIELFLHLLICKSFGVIIKAVIYDINLFIVGKNIY